MKVNPQTKATAIRDGALDQSPVVGGVHDFYRHPARFSPGFVRATIEAFTEPGELVLDPFVGGGTTLIEAQALGRRSAGVDVNPLAVFVSKANTTLYSAQALREVEVWRTGLRARMNTRHPAPPTDEWRDAGYLRNFLGTETWALRKLIAQALDALDELGDKPRMLARCALLRSAQWALDLRDELPSAENFRTHLIENLARMEDAAREYRALVLRTEPDAQVRKLVQPYLLESSAADIGAAKLLRRRGAPRLILTSPPYPGVYVLYHRWKIHARRETPIPYWIANSLDGRGISHYILGPRLESGLTQYFENLRKSFRAVASLCNEDTRLVQVVGFSEPDWQLPRYLEALKGAGLEEIKLKETATAPDGRLWRDVPGRRWFAKHQESAENTSVEVVLFHRLHS